MKKMIITALSLLMCAAAFGKEPAAPKLSKEFRKYHRIVAKHIAQKPNGYKQPYWKLNECDAQRLRKLEKSFTYDERLATTYRVFKNDKWGSFLRPAPIAPSRFTIKFSPRPVPKLAIIDGEVRDINYVGSNVWKAGDLEEWGKVLNLPPDDIESIEHLRGDNEKVVEMYGDKARNGILIITTKSAGKKE